MSQLNTPHALLHTQEGRDYLREHYAYNPQRGTVRWKGPMNKKPSNWRRVYGNPDYADNLDGNAFPDRQVPIRNPSETETLAIVGIRALIYVLHHNAAPPKTITLQDPYGGLELSNIRMPAKPEHRVSPPTPLTTEQHQQWVRDNPRKALEVLADMRSKGEI